MTRKTLKQMTDAECIEAHRLHQQGEGPAMISGYGAFCSYQTADAMISKGRRLVEAQASMKTFEARIWEKAEHWTFDTTVEAIDENAARAQLKKDYPARSYSVRDVRSVWRRGA